MIFISRWSLYTGALYSRFHCISMYSQIYRQDHPYKKTTCLWRHFTGSQGYIFHGIEPAYKDHLCIMTTCCWFLGWSLCTSFLYIFSQNRIIPVQCPYESTLRLPCILRLPISLVQLLFFNICKYLSNFKTIFQLRPHFLAEQVQ